MEKKRTYDKPVLRRVRLEVKTSVLATCHSSTSWDSPRGPFNEPCTNFATCHDYPLPPPGT
jgi:hypothetical protein